MKYKLAVFDMDGTILNTLEDLADSLNYILAKNNMPVRSLQQVRSFVGNGIRKLIERAVPCETPPSVIDSLFEEFCNYYRGHCAIKTDAYEGIDELLFLLKKSGCKIAVVSNKADFAVKELCNQYFKDIFDKAAGDKEGCKKKPAPDSVFRILNELNVEVKDAVYIGDSEVDIMTAENAGMDSIIVTWGFRDKSFLVSNGAMRIVDSPLQIAEIILN